MELTVVLTVVLIVVPFVVFTVVLAVVLIVVLIDDVLVMEAEVITVSEWTLSVVTTDTICDCGSEVT